MQIPSLLIRGRLLLIFAVILIPILLFAIYSTNMRQTDFNAYSCYMEYNHNNSNKRFDRLEDVLISDRKPKPGKTIFFHETSCHLPDSQYILNFTAREACAIESAALHNPNFEVFVLFASPTFLPEDQRYPLLEVVRSYKNVQLRQLNVWRYAEHTPIEDWLNEGDLFQSRYLPQHTSDLLRYLTLYRFGGIHLDMDVVVLRSFENIPLNYVGAHNNIVLGNAVIGLEPEGLGHEVAEMFLSEFQEHYNATDYIRNGPALIGRTMVKICRTASIQKMHKDPKRCRGFRVFNSSAFFPISWMQWPRFFDPQLLNDTLAKTKDSYLIHLWNKVSSGTHFKIGSNNAYDKYAELHCPKTYAAAGEYF